ncbi:hypothetical protein pb186bvf_019724 [Paramecium bursaria]
MIAVKLKQQKQGQQTQEQDKTNSAAWKRATSDQFELLEEQVPTIIIKYPDPKNILYLEAEIKPNEGMWKGATIPFTIEVTEEYPIEPPKVLCKKRLFHPNIDYEGKVCLNILRDGWKPVSSLKQVVYGLYFLFTHPNPNDPLNIEAAQIMKTDLRQFQQIVIATLKGGSYGQILFDKLG